MKTQVRWGVILGGSVAAMHLVFGLAGWHRIFAMSFVFLAIAISLNLVAVVQCLRARASTDGWVRQVANGLVVGLVGATIIFLASWLVTTTIVPDYFAEMAEGYRSTYDGLGLSEGEVADLVEATAATSPIKSAFDGVIGTMSTSLIAAAVAGIWLRKKTTTPQ